MGLQEELAELGIAQDLATEATAHAGDLDSALDWISSRQDASDAGMQGVDVSEGQTVLVCDECGRRMATAELAQLHATKEGHSSFSQAPHTPLTPAEVEARLAVLRARLSEKRAVQEKEDAAHNAELERIRRKSGAASEEARVAAREKAARLAAEQSKRERFEDAEALKRIRAEMAAEKAARQHKSLENSRTSATAAPVQTATSTTSATPCDRCRLQVRLPNGSAFRGTFAPEDTLDVVLAAILSAGHVIPPAYRLVVPIPRRELGTNATLSSLGLVPSSTLVLEPL